MYEFWYDYIKPKYGDKARPCYMDTDSSAMNIKTEDFYKDIASDTSNYDKKDNRAHPIGKNKKVIGSKQKHMRINQMIIQNIKRRKVQRNVQ